MQPEPNPPCPKCGNLNCLENRIVIPGKKGTYPVIPQYLCFECKHEFDTPRKEWYRQNLAMLPDCS